MKSQVLTEHFSRDRALYAGMTDALMRNECDILYADWDGALIFDMPGDSYLASALTDERAKYLAKLVGDADFVAVYGARFADRFRHPARKVKSSWLAAGYLKTTPVQYRADFEIRTLTREYLDCVITNYHGNTDRAYIEARFLSGMIGAFDGEKLMGFVGTHDNGEIGFLTTLPEYRGHGVAFALESEMTNRYLLQGRLPYGIIKPDNEISRALALKVGYTISDDRVVSFSDDDR